MDVADKLIGYFENVSQTILLFSGGFGSSALLWAAVKAKAPVTPLWINNGFSRCSEAEVHRQAGNVGGGHLQTVMQTPLQAVCRNTTDRCMHCKAQIIQIIKKQGYQIIDGSLKTVRTNLSAVDPEVQIKSPLIELGISYGQLVDEAESIGVDPLLCRKVSCLAGRFSHGFLISHERLDALRQMENLLIDKTADYEVKCLVENLDRIRIVLGSDSSFSYFSDPAARERIVQLGAAIGSVVSVDLRLTGEGVGGAV